MPLNLNIDVKSDSITKLIEAVAKYVEVRHEPEAIVLKAEAEAKASIVLAQADAKNREIAARTAHRIANLEIRRQDNIESITAKAVNELPPKVSKEAVSQDWIARFYEGCQDVGETDLQQLWGRLLAGEVAQPRTFSRRTMDALRAFSSEDAKVLSQFNSVVFTEINERNFVFVGFGSYQVCDEGIEDIENHLMSLGLLYTQKESPPWLTGDWHFCYCGKEYIVPINIWASMHAGERRTSEMAIRRFTVVGNELLKLLSRNPDQGFLEDFLKPAFANSQNQLLTPAEFRKLQEQREKNKRGSG